MLFGVRRKRSSSSEHLHGSREVPGAGEKAVGCVRPHWGWLGPGGGGGSDAGLACPDATWRCGEGSGAAIRRFYLLYTYIYITIY